MSAESRSDQREHLRPKRFQALVVLTRPARESGREWLAGFVANGTDAQLRMGGGCAQKEVRASTSDGEQSALESSVKRFAKAGA